MGLTLEPIVKESGEYESTRLAMALMPCVL